MRPDIALRLLRDGYRAVPRLRESHGGGRDWFEARMLGRRALVVRGVDGVRTFYDSALVTRHGAVPAPIRLLLFGRGAVHGLDDARHAERKRIFLQVVDRAAVQRLAQEVSHRLERAADTWTAHGSVRLFDELVEVYGSAVLDWAGVATVPGEANTTSRRLASIVDGFGIAGTTYLRACAGRIRANRWARRVIRDVRAGRRQPPPDTPLARVAATDLGDTVAAVELLNILRPTVAVAYFGAYSAHALASRPEWRDRLATGSTDDLRAFEHEVRRWYPFAPVLAGRLRREFVWEGRAFPRRSWIVLDILGTNRDPGAWPDPDTFRPERFVGREPGPFEYVPHGGGDPATGHRCPGEPLAVGILEATLRVLAGLDFELADESRDVPLRRIPSLPPGRMELRKLRRALQPHGA